MSRQSAAHQPRAIELDARLAVDLIRGKWNSSDLAIRAGASRSMVTAALTRLERDGLACRSGKLWRSGAPEMSAELARRSAAALRTARSAAGWPDDNVDVARRAHLILAVLDAIAEEER